MPPFVDRGVAAMMIVQRVSATVARLAGPNPTTGCVFACPSVDFGSRG